MKKNSLVFLITISLLFPINLSTLWAIDSDEESLNPSWIELSQTSFVLTGLDISKLPPYIVSLSKKGTLDVNKVTPSVINRLSLKETKNLMKFLAKYTIKIKWADHKGEIGSGKIPKVIRDLIPIGTRDKVNAATAIFIKTAIRSSSNNLIVAKTLASAPKEILKDLPPECTGILTGDVVGEALWELTKSSGQETGVLPPPKNIAIMQKCIKITYRYIKFWGGKNPGEIKKLAQRLVHKSCYDGMNSIQIGIIIGSILSGASQRASEIKQIDERRLLIIDSVSNLAWASTVFIGLIGLSTPLFIPAIVLAGAVGTGAVIIESVNHLLITIPRDFISIVKKTQGAIETTMLQRAITPQQKMVVNDVLSWMRATIHVGGHHD